MLELSDQVFDTIRVYIYKICGINLGIDKKYLVKQRFAPLLKEHDIGNFAELAQKISLSPSRRLKDDLILAITTNETSFFRDKMPFDIFEMIVMKELIKTVKERKKAQYVRRGPKVTMWCAAASTGQEPYTIAMILDKAIKPYKLFKITKDDFSLLATDIDSNALAKAIKGKYSDFEVARGLPDEYKKKYFINENNSWFIKDEIKDYIDFKQLNLIENFSRLGAFDVIFARNILIYFSIETKREIIKQFAQMLNKNGILILGSTENIYDLSDDFEAEHYERVILYRKK